MLRCFLGLDTQIQEIKESVELPLTHPEYYEEMGIKPPKGVILYGPPGTGKTLLAKAVANQTSATFLRVVGSELIQKYLVGPFLIRTPLGSSGVGIFIPSHTRNLMGIKIKLSWYGFILADLIDLSISALFPNVGLVDISVEERVGSAPLCPHPTVRRNSVLGAPLK